MAFTQTEWELNGLEGARFEQGGVFAFHTIVPHLPSRVNYGMPHTDHSPPSIFDRRPW